MCQNTSVNYKLLFDGKLKFIFMENVYSNIIFKYQDFIVMATLERKEDSARLSKDISNQFSTFKNQNYLSKMKVK